MARCAFAKIVLNDLFVPRYPFDSDLEMRYLYLEDGSEKLILGSFDVSHVFRDTSLEIRAEIAQATAVPVNCILLHELQSHSAPEALDLVGEPTKRIAEKSAAVLVKAIESAQECEVAWIVADVGDAFNHVREQYLPDVGVVTVWKDYQYAEDGRAHMEDTGKMLLRGWHPDVAALNEQLYFDRPTDSLVPLIIFRRPSGEILGSVCRFAAHVTVMNLLADQDYHYSVDFPGYLRQRLEERFGGMGIYLNGPCADLSSTMRLMPTLDERRGEAQRIGRGIADAAATAFTETAPVFAPLHLEGISHQTLELPMRDTIPRSRGELPEIPRRIEDAETTLRTLIAERAWPTTIKRQIDHVNHLSSIESLLDRWINLSEDELSRRVLTVGIVGFSLNGLVFVGLPGEALTNTSQWLRNQSYGARVVTIDQVNGYCAYLVTRERYDEGGYAFWCSVLTRDAEPLLRLSALGIMRQVTKAPGESVIQASS